MVSPKNSPASCPAAQNEAQQGMVLGVLAENQNSQKPDVDAVQSRLEELLSKQNLVDDAYLQQHMNAQMYIPLPVLARHHSLCILGDEAGIIAAAREAAQKSDKFGVDEQGLMIRPLIKPRRNTLILRELPEEFPEEDLQTLFKSCPESESFCSLKPDVNNTAYITFKTENAAQNTALWLRSQKLQGAEIKCAVKSECFVRSFYPASPGPMMQASPYMMPQPSMAWGYPQWLPASGWQGPTVESPSSNADALWGDVQTDSSRAQDGTPQTFPDGKGKSKGKEPTKRGSLGGKTRKRGSLGGSFLQDESGGDFGTPTSGPASRPFTPLQQPGVPPEGPFEPGYKHEFRKYARQYIIEVCNAMEDIKKPESYAKSEVALFRSSPCKDWAPPPTPVTAYMSSFFKDDGRGASDQEDGGRERTGRSSRKGSKQESDWSRGNSSWVGESSRFDKQWVKKDDANQAEEGGAPRKMSWADKVRGAESSDGSNRWVAKPKSSDDASTQAKDGGANAAEEASAGSKPSSEVKSAAADDKGSSWADKVRKGSASQ